MSEINYNKLLYLLPIVILIVILILICTIQIGNKKTVCTMKSNQRNNGYKMDNKYIIYSNNDLVKNVEINELIISKDKKILKEFKKQLEEQYENNKKTYGGYTYKVTMNDNKVETNVKVDYSKIDMDKYIKNNTAMTAYIEDNQVTLDGIKKMYKATGATCK